MYMGSAPTLQLVNKGIDDRSIKLGCVQPGELRPQHDPDRMPTER